MFHREHTVSSTDIIKNVLHIFLRVQVHPLILLKHI